MHEAAPTFILPPYVKLYVLGVSSSRASNTVIVWIFDMHSSFKRSTGKPAWCEGGLPCGMYA